MGWHLVDKQFFKKYQRYLVLFSNTSFGRWFFKIHNDIPREKKIVRILPNCFTWFDHIENGRSYYKTDFRTHAKFSKRLNALFIWLPFNAYKRIEIDGEWFLQPKLGFTVSTFYPDANPETTSVDGRVGRDVAPNGETFSTIRSGVGTTSADAATDEPLILLTSDDVSADWQTIYRSVFGFDTSSIPDADTISAATLSFFGLASSSDNFSQSVVIDRNPPASATALVNGDYDLSGWDGVEQATGRITITAWSTSAYNDFTLNATGIGNISKTGVSWFGTRGSSDFDNSAPTWSSSLSAIARSYFADQTGTANDPKLVVTHATVTTTSSSSSSSTTSSSSSSTTSSSTTTSTSSTTTSSSTSTTTSSTTSSTSSSTSSTSTSTSITSSSSSSTTTNPPYPSDSIPEMEIRPIKPILEVK